MKMVFQVIKVEDGTRSEAFTADRTEMVEKFKELIPETEHDQHAILVLLEDREGEIYFSRAPYMLVSHFVQLFGSPT